MNLTQTAATLDHLERFIEAAWAYELAVLESESTIELYLDLVAIYFALNESPAVAAHPIGQAISGIAFSRAYSLMRSAEEHFGINPELSAWRLHFQDRILGEIIDMSLFEELAVQGSTLAQLLVFRARGGFASEVREVCRREETATTERQRIYLSYGT